MNYANMHKICVECILHAAILDYGWLLNKTQIVVQEYCMLSERECVSERSKVRRFILHMAADVPLVWTPAPQFS